MSISVLVVCSPRLHIDVTSSRSLYIVARLLLTVECVVLCVYDAVVYALYRQ